MDTQTLVIFLEEINSKLQWMIDANASLLVEMQTIRRELSEQIGDLLSDLDNLTKKHDAMTADVPAD